MSAKKVLTSASVPLAAMCLAPLACFAQGNTIKDYTLYTLTVKPSMTAKFEQGLKKLITYEQGHGGPHYRTFEPMTGGAEQGDYVILVPISWSGIDHPPSDMAGYVKELRKDVVPYVASSRVSDIQEVPNFEDDPGNTTTEKYYHVNTMRIKIGKLGDFFSAWQQLTAAARKEAPKVQSSFFRQMAGGSPYEVTATVGYDSAADVGRGSALNTAKVLREAYGPGLATSIMTELYGSIASWDSELDRYRPDLSFPSSQHAQ